MLQLYSARALPLRRVWPDLLLPQDLQRHLGELRYTRARKTPHGPEEGKIGNLAPRGHQTLARSQRSSMTVTVATARPWRTRLPYFTD